MAAASTSARALFDAIKAVIDAMDIPDYDGDRYGDTRGGFAWLDRGAPSGRNRRYWMELVDVDWDDTETGVFTSSLESMMGRLDVYVDYPNVKPWDRETMASRDQRALYRAVWNARGSAGGSIEGLRFFQAAGIEPHLEAVVADGDPVQWILSFDVRWLSPILE